MRACQDRVHGFAVVPAALLQVAATAIVLAVLPYRSFSAQEYFLPKAMVLHAAAWTALIALFARSTELRISATDLAVAAFLVWSTAASMGATDQWAASFSLANTVSLAAVFWTTRQVASHPENQRRMLAAVVIAAGISACIGLGEAYGLLPRLARPGLGPGGTLGNRSFLAYFALLTLPAAIGMTNARLRGSFRVTGLLVCGMSAALITLTRSRASWLGTLGMMCVALCAWMHFRGPNGVRSGLARLAPAATSMLLGVVLAVLVPNRLTWYAESPYADSLRRLTDFRNGSGLQRSIEYGSTLRMIRDHPVVGVGPYNWQVEYPRFAATSDPSFDPRALRSTPPFPSSDWLGVSAERGVPALLILLVVAFLLVREAGAVQRAAETEQPGMGDRRVLLAVTLTGLAIVGAVDVVLLTPAAAYAIAVILGSVVPRQAGSTLSLTRPVRVVTLVIVSAIGGAVTADSARRVVAVHLAREQWDVARLETAVRWDPHHYELRMLLARQWIATGGCHRAIAHATTARSLRPLYPAPERLLRYCTPQSNATQED